MAELASGGGDLLLVTGASGFLGAAIANSARAAGYSVRVLIRTSSPRTNIDRKDQVAIGDLRDRASLAAALRGVRYLVHAAADYRLWAPTPDDILRNNVDGTRTLMEEALQAGIERIVYTSSVATIGLRKGEPADETRPLAADKAVGAYKKSKVMAERLVDDMIRREGLPAVIVNPSTPIGPRDVKPTPTGRIIVEAASGRMPGFVDTGLNLVHVDDAAAGHLAALRKGRIGERYILGGRNMSLREILQALSSLTGLPAPRLRLPYAVAYCAGAVDTFLARFTGSSPRIPLEGVRMARYKMYVCSAKAARELGYQPGPVERALERAVQWFRRNTLAVSE